MKDYLPLVTAVITTYKRQPEIVQRAVNSVLKQTYKNIELIVVDDSPASFVLRNAVKESVLSSGSNIVYISHEENKGACVARNTGLKAAHGEYIAYLDDDDEWMSTKIEKQIEYIKENGVALVYCGYKHKNDSKDITKDVVCSYHEGNLYEKLLIEGNFIGSTSFSLIKKECLENVGGFDPLMESAQDADVWLRIAREYSIGCVKETLVVYHTHEGERITTNPKKKISGIERLVEKNREFIQSNKESYSRFCRLLAELYSKDRKFKTAIKYWWCATQMQPTNWKENIKCICKVVLR